MKPVKNFNKIETQNLTLFGETVRIERVASPPAYDESFFLAPLRGESPLNYIRCDINWEGGWIETDIIIRAGDSNAHLNFPRGWKTIRQPLTPRDVRSPLAFARTIERNLFSIRGIGDWITNKTI